MNKYKPPKIWTWDKENGGKFSKINRPFSGSTHQKKLPVGKHPFQLYSQGTPNGIKVTILLEELLEIGIDDAEYDAWLVEIGKGDQFSSGFVEINPNSKIPVLVCPDGQTIFETVAIVTHLIEKFPQLAPHTCSSERNLLWQYLAMIATSIYAGYHRQFYSHRYAPKDVAEDVGKLAAQDRETAYNFINMKLNPYLLGENKSAVDYYLYMVTRWDPSIDNLLNDKDNLGKFLI